jgi:hypothetical protein
MQVDDASGGIYGWNFTFFRNLFADHKRLLVEKGISEVWLVRGLVTV